MSLLSISDEKWKVRAACKGMDPNLFFYEDDAPIEQQLAVDSICAGCPVQVDCREYAERNKLEGGVFGRKFFSQAPKKRNKKK